jgi:hypothetical protein
MFLNSLGVNNEGVGKAATMSKETDKLEAPTE